MNTNTLLVFLIYFVYFVYNHVLENVSDSSDEIIHRRVELFRKHCHGTSTCSKKVFWGPNNNSFSSDEIPCCEPCSCSDDCGLSCCPDRSGRLETEEELYNAKEVFRCFDSVYRNTGSSFLKDNFLNKLYKMIVECPYNYTNQDIIQKCRRENNEIRFDVPLRYILPVYDPLTDLNYKNIYCAQCHNIGLSDLEFASLQFDCRWDKWTMTYIRDINTKLDQERLCNVIFEPYNGTVCDPNFIDICNVTGLWEVYDRELEESCLTYRSVYDGNYKNIHCFFCNGFNESTIPHSCSRSDADPVFVIRLLEFMIPQYDPNYGVVLKNEEKNASCSSNVIYNSEERSSWILHCPVGMTLIFVSGADSCFPTPDALNHTPWFEVSLMLELNSRDQSPIHEILVNMTLEIDRKVKELTSGYLCQISGFIHFKNELGNGKGDNSPIDVLSIRYIAVRISLYIHPSKRGFARFLDFTLVFTKLLNYGNFAAKFRHFEMDSFQEHMHQFTSCFEYQSLIRKMSVCTYVLNQTDRLNFRIFDKSTSEMSCSIASHEIHRPESVIQVEPEPFCPRVVLPKLAFADDLTYCSESTYLARILTEKCLSSVLTENTTHLFFCHEDYFQHLTNQERDIHPAPDMEVPSSNERNLKIMYVSIVVLSLSLIALILTLIIYSIFAALRTLPGLNNMALVCSLIIFQTMCLINTIAYIDIDWVCTSFAVVTHFSLICSFIWMFICTFHMMKVFVKIRNRAVAQNKIRTFVIYTICSICVAICAVVSTITVAMVMSDGRDIGYGGVGCDIKHPMVVLCAVVIPVAIIVVFNVCMYCVVVFKISKRPHMVSSRSSERADITIFAKLSTITGLTWVFGFVFVFTKVDAFAYIFHVFSAGQSVFIMLSFVCNRRVLDLIRRNSALTKKKTSKNPSSIETTCKTFESIM